MGTFVNNAWYVAAWGNEVRRELLPRTLLGQQILLCIARKTARPSRLWIDAPTNWRLCRWAN